MDHLDCYYYQYYCYYYYYYFLKKNLVCFAHYNFGGNLFYQPRFKLLLIEVLVHRIGELVVQSNLFLIRRLYFYFFFFSRTSLYHENLIFSRLGWGLAFGVHPLYLGKHTELTEGTEHLRKL